MTINHTPGPWAFELEPNGCTYSIWYDDDTMVAEAQTLEDAKLIRMAPDLLEALKVIANSEEYHGDTVVCDFHSLQSVARAAIAEVEGN